MSGLAISTSGLVHIYRSQGHDVAALSGIGITVRPGEFVGLLGPSGAGKSTLLQLCGGLLTPSAGRLQIGEHNLTTMTEPELDRMRARDVGIVLQGAGRNLIPYLSPVDNVRYAQRAASRDRSLPAPEDVLDLVGLTDHARTPLPSLTPGQIQLCAVAVGIATFPGLLLADEPTSQLDHRARDEVLAAISTINTSTGMTVLLVTHDPDVAAVLPRTVTIRDGRIASEGRSGEEFAVVATDGSLPLPPHVAELLPPGTLLRVTTTEAGDVRLSPVQQEGQS
ncbi:ABC-type lipoprotein export system ATPase subunit [Kribbella pratensis]|jgi:ABC-type lipoprotein export system ATPase subunit|uniref:ABC-type lipoprotein export system ATPase subunit n=1 Tax=Kribbella pratensis TaxID=2512112 RepID=A0ABY2FRY8_9ACTN|nr:ATP-binding cassette domain-containing protein [Kribbella pratensis]TDW95549.1 ABC-type lipoprotein export system ATPase subunit [Kribbella pratensis]